MQALEQPYHAQSNSLKRRSRSPSPQPHKRRPPPSYAPALYADLPCSGAPALLRADSAGTACSLPLSARSSPGAGNGAEWLQARTSALHLQTPEGRTPAPPDGEGAEVAMEEVGMGETEVGMGLDGGGGGEPPDSAMQFDPPALYAPQPAVPLSVHASSSPFFPFTTTSASLPPAPHDAPPLHCHLAGSPQPAAAWPAGEGMARSPSDGSVQSMRSAGEGAGGEPEPPRKPRAGAAGGGGGWKVTMGFRADCERCARREQGHYTHVVWSS
ncbi:hypothetical protein JCM10450v2_001677 [Rhodotorula kratochvilovae]